MLLLLLLLLLNIVIVLFFTELSSQLKTPPPCSIFWLLKVNFGGQIPTALLLITQYIIHLLRKHILYIKKAICGDL